MCHEPGDRVPAGEQAWVGWHRDPDVLAEHRQGRDRVLALARFDERRQQRTVGLGDPEAALPWSTTQTMGYIIDFLDKHLMA